jgi:hypothetical protein
MDKLQLSILKSSIILFVEDVEPTEDDIDDTDDNEPIPAAIGGLENTAPVAVY